MTNLELAKAIVKLIGGKENVIKTANCMTRLRLTLKDTSTVNIDSLKNIEGVLGVIENGNYLQVVLGPGKAKKVTDICVEELGLPRDGIVTEGWKENKEAIKASQKENKFKKLVNTIANIFIPLIPAIIAAGIFNGLGSLISTLQGQGTLPAEGIWKAIQLMFALIGGGFLSYFAIYTGINSAKQFGATEALGGMLGAISISANINALATMLGLFNEEIPLNSILTTGKGGIIGVIFGVYILAKIEKLIRKKIPDVLD